MAHPYVCETWTDDEADLLRRYFTNLEGPVFALVNLPEVVKGALFARYSRSDKSLRRLFLDEFVGELDTTGDLTVDATMGLKRAEDLYQRVFYEYGDDSVAQLGGVHLACEQASNLLTKILERGRLMSYLEQSTRYIAYDSRLGGRYRYHRDPAVLASPLGTRYVAEVDGMFEAYSTLVPVMEEYYRSRHPKEPGDSDLVWRRSVRAKSFDALRGLLPAAALSNVGIYGTGQGYEMLLLRMRACPLPEAQAYSAMMLTELRKVIPSFLSRVDRPDRGGAWSDYLAATATATRDAAERLVGDSEAGDRPAVTLVHFEADAEDSMLAGMLYPFTDLPDDQLLDLVKAMTSTQRAELAAAYFGDRRNRRHKPGRALERVSYRFDVLSDYGAFRDLQRHRMLSIQWQRLTPEHGFSVPGDVVDAGVEEVYSEAMVRSAELYESLAGSFPEQAPYAVALGYRIRYSMEMNAREATHVLELRTAPAGHPEYRRICQEMHRLIRDQAGHRLVADLMRFVDHDSTGLERLDAERRAESRRRGPVTSNDQPSTTARG